MFNLKRILLKKLKLLELKKLLKIITKIKIISYKS
jgi:hypothetical protein